ncbi:hypothetical protein ABZ356_10175 [Micromonospora zamorensis]|uniref:hypothetical protein n=1 Tax=Micromonospora zamorensis TaxID=709883 RepID=UPI0033AE4668
MNTTADRMAAAYFDAIEIRIAAGADAAYLHSSAMGRPLYESTGFALLETWTAFQAR